MKSQRKAVLAFLGTVLVAGLVMACAGRSNVEGQQEKAMQSKTQDSLVAAKAAQDPQDALLYVDELAAKNAETTERLAYYRALVYNKMGRKQKVEEWCEKALEGDGLQKEDAAVFYHACDLLSSTLTYRGDDAGALSAAQRGLSVASEDMTGQGRYWTAVLLHDVGYCEMQFGRIDEAEKYFSQAYITLKRIATNDDKYTNLQTYARVSYNIVDAYTSTEQYDKAKAWIESAEDAVDKLAASPECSEEQEESYRGGLSIQKAIALLQTGNRAEADASYKEALALDYAQTDLGILERASYLELAERWDDLTELMPRIDSLADAWGNPSSLAHWEKYLAKGDAKSDSSLPAKTIN